MLDNGSYFGTCHNHYPNAMSMHSPDWSTSAHSNRRFAMETMALDGTFDVRPVRRVWHKTVAAIRCCWAFDTDQLVRLHPLNTLVAVLNDAKRKRANRPNVTAIQLMLLERNEKNRNTEIKMNKWILCSRHVLIGLPGAAVDQ